MEKITHINLGDKQIPNTPMEHMNLGDALLQLEHQGKIESTNVHNDLLNLLDDSYLLLTKKNAHGGFEVYNLTTEADLADAMGISNLNPNLNKVFVLPKNQFTEPQQIPAYAEA